MLLLHHILKSIIVLKSGQNRSSAVTALRDQENILLKFIRKNKDTAYGKTHNFDRIFGYEDFVKHIPVNDYDTLKPYFEMMLEGKSQILWYEKIAWFSKSSGTTADKSKYIPVSPSALKENHYKGGYDVIAQYLINNPSSKLLSGKSLIIGGSQKPHQEGSHIHSGDISAVITVNQPRISQWLRTPPNSVTLMPDFEEKLNLTMDIATKENVSFFVGVPTWFSVLFEKIKESKGVENLLEVWPNMELFIHGGVSFVPYENQYKKFFPSDNMHYIQTYNASEGFFAYQDRLIADDMLLATHHGIFYEFIEMAYWQDEHPPCLPLRDVVIGKQYAIVITTNAGLWRYKIGDTVVFTSTDPYRIKVSGRTKSFINAFGEELMVDNADQGIKNTCAKTGAIIRDYTAAPVYFEGAAKACHQWLIEFEVAPQDISKFGTLLDNHLQELNSDYEAKRFKDLALAPLQIITVRENTFVDWLKSKGKLGGQNKIPRLNNDRRIVEELLSMQ
jgi:hypothetical protein